MHFIGFYDYTVWLTYLSLASATVGMISAFRGDARLAVFCLMFSGFCDLFDGIVARTKKDRTQDQKNFGIQIDSLSDVIAFGVLPALIFYRLGVNGAIGTVILVCYVLCGLIRLAFFNVLETKRQADPTAPACAKEFRGMPITFSAMIAPVVFAVSHLLPSDARTWFLHIAPALMAFLFVFDVRIPKLDVGKLLFGKKN